MTGRQLIDDVPGTSEWPDSTSENRAKLGCFGKEVGSYDECWCGYCVVGGYGCCHECQGMLRGCLLFKSDDDDFSSPDGASP